MNATELQAWLIGQIAEVTGAPRDAIDAHRSFEAHGLSSRDAVTLAGDLEDLLGRDLPPTLVYDYPTIASLSQYLGNGSPMVASGEASSPAAEDPGRPIAIIGMACRFPGADGPDAFWRLLQDGVDAIGEVPPSRWDGNAFYHPDSTIPGKAVSRWGGFLNQVDGFDAFFFGISPGEAERMDPQQRLLLELAWEAFEDAGHPMSALAGSATGVFVGISINEYAFLQAGQPELITGHSGTGTALSIAANRISYFFDLRGPSLVVDTACSSSLTAVHLACRSLRAGESRLAIAGGVNLILSPDHSIAFSKAGVLAPDGRCKAFDARADGYVRGEGGGLVVLKPLAHAIQDGDTIHAVIRGSALHQDGRTNGLMAPSREAQEAVLVAAHRDAGVSPRQVQYVEAHGTGTLLGDAIEARALGAILSQGRAGEPCRIGSVKSNIGHLEAAAGIAGLIKVALSIRHGIIPPSLHVTVPNPQVPFTELGLRIQDSIVAWPDSADGRIAGVSSFGFGGTNGHLVVSNAPAPRTRDAAHGPGSSEGAALLPLSARTSEALPEVCRSFRELLASPAVNLHHLCATASLRRNHLEHRVAFLGDSASAFALAIEDHLRDAPNPGILAGSRLPDPGRGPVFVFSGQGGQWASMGRELLETEPVFREIAEQCDALLRCEAGWSLLTQLSGGDRESRLAEIDVLQPTLFSLQVGLAALWRSWGIEPAAVVGHSLGEVAAACIAGALTLEDAVHVICARSRLLKRLSGSGGMAVTGLSAAETAARLSSLGGSVAIAASNSPRTTVVSGDTSSLAALMRDLERDGVFGSLIDVDVPSHGPLTWPLRDELQSLLGALRPSREWVPFFSTVSGCQCEGATLTAEYWAANLCEPVRFSDAIARLATAGHGCFLEIGPHPVLRQSIQQNLLHLAREGLVLHSLMRGEGSRASLLRSLGELYASGADIDWRRLHPVAVPQVPLPAYPWERTRFWMVRNGEQDRVVADAKAGSAGLLGRRTDLADAPGSHVWERTIDPRQFAFVKDHRVNGAVVLPLAAYADMAFSAALDAGLAAAFDLQDLALHAPMVFGEGESRSVQVALATKDAGAAEFRVHSRAPGDVGTWTLHATAVLGPVAENQGFEAIVPGEVATRCQQQMDHDDLYRELETRGLRYGPALQVVTRLWRRDGEAIGRLGPDGREELEVKGHRMHSVLLDGALHVLAATRLSGSEGGSGGDSWWPVGCRRLRWIGHGTRAAWSHAVLTQATEREVQADLHVVDEAGAPILEVEGLRLTRITGQGDKASAPHSDAWLYHIHWEEAAWPRPAAGPLEDSGVRWLILADSAGLGEALARRLRASGREGELISPGSETGAGLRPVFSGARAPLYAVIDLRAAVPEDQDAPTITGIRQAQHRGSEAVVDLAQALMINSASLRSPRLWLVTRGAQVILPDERPILAHSPIWGLARSLRFEVPALRCTTVDLDPDADVEAAAELLFRQLGLEEAEDQIALRGARRFVARLRPYVPADRAGSCRFAADDKFRDDATYLVVGGLGGLGLKVARWMLERGARHLVLAGRSAPTPEVTEAIEEMQRRGAEVTFAALDVTRQEEVVGLLEQLRTEGRVLRGVIHAAGVLHNASLADLDTERMRRVMAARVDGAWNLHAATMQDPLDFFVLFSSAVSVLGSPGQANYAAGASFMDAVAHYRQSLGLPALSINWGPWAQVGLVADGVRAPGPSGSQGVKGLDPATGVEMLGRLLRDGGAQVTVLPFNIQDLLELYPPAAGMPFFAEVGGRESHVSRLYARPRLRQAYVAPRDEIERQLAELWKQTLRIDRVGIHDSFFELGGDSVLAAQVVTLAQRTFGVQLDLREAFQGFTIEHLARQLAPALTSRSTPAPEAAGAPIEVSLSFVQERQLFLELLEPMTAVNNLATCLRLDGRLDPASLQRSADVILQRHQVLRSAFTLDQGRSVVRIVPSLRVGLKVVEVEDGPDRMARLQRVANREAGTPFDVTVPPLLRFTLFRLSATEHVLLIVIHHAIADGWSLGVFLRELFTLYHGGKLAPLAMQYADHAARQRRSISDPRMLEQLTFWREALGGELMALDLPIDHARLPRQTFSGGAHRLHLESPLTARLKELGRVHDATLFMVLLAAFKAVLHRYTGQQDLVVGTPTAGRMAADTTDLIGPFINTLVLRTDLSGDPGFGELLDRVRAVALAAYAYQEVPFERLVIELNPARDLSRTPLFQVLFILQNTPWPDVDVPGLKVSRVPVHRGVAAFDLTLEATEGGGGLDAVFEYNRDLFEPETVARLAASWELLLQDAAAHPERRLSELATMSAGDRDLLVTTLNRTEADYPGDCCVHQLFESSVERVPGNLAVQCGGDTVSYEVLEAWANRIAHDLRGLGVGPEVVVAAQLPRSVALVASLLGVLKAAGAYLAIDPDCPADRLEFILHDAGARLLITGEPGAPEGVPRFTDLGRPEGSDVPRWHRAGPPSPDGLTARNLAYLIYTSGSTGQPKGVEVEHRSLVNLLWSLRQVAGIGDGDTLLAVTSVGFDIAALELFLPLITGATVALAPPGMSRDGRALAAALAEPGVRVMQATPATWQLLIRDGWKGQPGLVALSGGEALPPALADQLLDRVAVLWNVYGPTETTVWSTAGRVERGQALISVGRPLANTRLYLLDAERRLVPFGVAGELAIAGDGVARGYRNRPALTARRFVPESVNPAATAGRMFLTGDVARYLPDGSLQVLGRLDDQVKVNGCRIEPDEIAAALCRHPAVHQAAVVAHEAPGGDRVLVAYHVPTGSSPEESGRLRDFLRATLPAYMVPARYVPLARLPLTPSGKVDRRALPLPGPDIGDAPEHPRSPLEEQLAALYTAALGLERVGVDDNFFDLGGGSLQIIEIVARGRDLGLALIPELFFEHQTIAALASHFEAVAAEEPVAGAHA